MEIGGIMRIGIIQATSQKDKNEILEEYVRQAVTSKGEVVNFGIFSNSDVKLSYVQISLAIALLINSGAVDFIVTGCSSGQGMMLACNTFPNIQCGYLPTAQDAFLFAQINNGNVASLPLGLNWGWCGELKCNSIIDALFKEKMGQGYSAKDAERKRYNTKQVKRLNEICKVPFKQILTQISPDILYPILNYAPVYEFIMQNGRNFDLINLLQDLKSND